MNESTRGKTALQQPVAIIGIGCMFPRAGDTGAYWANIRERVDAVTEVVRRVRREGCLGWEVTQRHTAHPAC